MKKSEKNKPRFVSVIIPAHNGEKYLPEAIESILAQDYPHYDIWVIDNASTDKTKKVVERYPQVHYDYSEIPNTCLARNRGILLSNGEFVTFLDQDDTWVPHKLSLQVRFLESNPGYGAVVGFQKMYLEENCVKPHWLKQGFLEEPQQGYLPSALMVRRHVLEATGGFDSAFSLASDVDWFFKAKHRGILVGHLEEVVVCRRIHSDNASDRCQVLHSQILAVIKNSLKKRRENL